MNLQLVKTAPGRRLRHPVSKKVLPNAADAAAKPIEVDLDHPHWYRAHKNGDIVIVPKPAAAVAPAAAPAPAAPVILAADAPGAGDTATPNKTA